jgi:hypothetical protein
MTFFLNIEIITYWIDFDQYGLIFKIHDSGHETIITPNKINQNKLCMLIFNKPIVEL